MKYRIKYIGDQNKYISAIKIIRQTFFIGLKEAKDFVDTIRYGDYNTMETTFGDVKTGIHYTNSGAEVLLIEHAGKSRGENYFDNKLFEI